MEEIKVKGMAKINIALDALRKREDGYHEVQMIMQQVGLFDEIHLKKIQKGIVIETNCEFIPTDESNIAYKAAELMMKKYNIQDGICIYINKKIPVGAGLAGVSTDAAAVLKGLNELFGIGASEKELMEMGTNIGADVPFCIVGGAALAEGIGEKLTPIKGIDQWVLLCKPNISVSTATVYKKLDVSKIKKHPKTNKLLKAIENNDIQTVALNLCNVLETVTEKMHPVVRDIKRRMLEYNAMGSLMSGSGPTVFGLYKDYGKAKSAYDNLSKIYQQVYLVKSYIGDE